MAEYLPVVYDQSADTHRPMQVGDRVSESCIPVESLVSNASGNALEAKNGKFFVKEPDKYVAGSGVTIVNNVVSAHLKAEGHIFTDYQGMYVDMRGLISTDLKNAIAIGSDGNLYVNAAQMGGGGGDGSGGGTVDPRDLVSNVAGNILYVERDGKLYVKVDIPEIPEIPDMRCNVSSDQGNLLTLGSDQYPYLGDIDLGTI